MNHLGRRDSITRDEEFKQVERDFSKGNIHSNRAKIIEGKREGKKTSKVAINDYNKKVAKGIWKTDCKGIH